MAKYKLPKIQDLISAGVHFGHQVKRWHPKMEPYIYTVNKNVHIIDLEQTEKMLKDACEYLYKAASEGKKIAFVGTKKQSKEIVELEAKRCGALYVSERWIGGTITNFQTIKKNLDKLINYMKGREDGSFDKYTKKERLMIDREIEKLQKMYGGIVSLKDIPQVLFVIDPRREKTAVREAKVAKVPVVALIDTNADPTPIDYPIPGNDDAIKSVAMIVKAVADAIEEGYVQFGKDKAAKDAELEAAAKKAAEEKAKEVEKAKALKEAKEFEEKVEKEEEKKAKKISKKSEDEETEKEKKPEKKEKKSKNASTGSALKGKSKSKKSKKEDK